MPDPIHTEKVEIQTAKVEPIKTDKVEIQTPEVKIQKPPAEKSADGLSIAPTTTKQEDITKASQRRINFIWEFTQAAIAIVVVLSNMIVGITFGIRGTAAGEYPLVLSSSLFLVVGFYFSRTNHTAIGGVAANTQPDVR